MASHSSTLAWRIPWTEEPGRLKSKGSQRVGHNQATSLSLFTFMQLEKEMATHSKCSCLENPRDGGVWWAAVYGVAQSRTRLKRLSSSSSRSILVLCSPVLLGQQLTSLATSPAQKAVFPHASPPPHLLLDSPHPRLLPLSALSVSSACHIVCKSSVNCLRCD